MVSPKKEQEKEYEDKINNQQESQQQKKGNTVKTAEDEIFLNQLKAMKEADEDMIVFLEDVRAVGLKVWPGEIIRVYEEYIKHAEGKPGIIQGELSEEMKMNLRGYPEEKGTALVLSNHKAWVSFDGNPHPLEALRKLFRKPERIVIQKKGGA